MRFVFGVALMVGSSVFAFLYDTGRWPAIWSVIEHGQLPTNFGQVAPSGVPLAPMSNPPSSNPGQPTTIPGGTPVTPQTPVGGGLF